jgi:hypothetical protein
MTVTGPSVDVFHGVRVEELAQFVFVPVAGAGPPWPLRSAGPSSPRRPGLPTSRRAASTNAELVDILDEVFRSRTLAEWERH